ncbi:hypothetical protein C8F04DRAFT_299593 [Mycena alexandri]|uniref:Uncharacterized protein n=1 Tax=Mycena alexandri TaxID=1745969 RepID=A0AAD6T5A2_9AGAR|nr:hypothetical protein C8F04DRAFT_299593 [Mycena alexandri]
MYLLSSPDSASIALLSPVPMTFNRFGSFELMAAAAAVLWCICCTSPRLFASAPYKILTTPSKPRITAISHLHMPHQRFVWCSAMLQAQNHTQGQQSENGGEKTTIRIPGDASTTVLELMLRRSLVSASPLTLLPLLPSTHRTLPHARPSPTFPTLTSAPLSQNPTKNSAIASDVWYFVRGVRTTVREADRDVLLTKRPDKKEDLHLACRLCPGEDCTT